MVSEQPEDVPPPEAPLPGLGYEDASESDEHPAAAGFVRARVRVARTPGPKGPSFQKVAGRSPGAPPPSESNPRLRPAPGALPEVNAAREHHGSLLEPIIARRTWREAFVGLAQSLERAYRRVRARHAGYELFLASIGVAVTLAVALVVVARARRVDPTSAPLPPTPKSR